MSKYENGERRLDLIEFLEIAKALDVDSCKFINELEQQERSVTLFDEWEITAEHLTKIITENPSARGMLFGYVAEYKLREIITTFPEISYMTKFDDHNRKRRVIYT